MKLIVQKDNWLAISFINEMHFTYLREIHPNMADYGVNSFLENKSARIQAIIESYRTFQNSFKI